MTTTAADLPARARREAERLDVETNARFEGVSDEVERLDAAIATTVNWQAMQTVGF